MTINYSVLTLMQICILYLGLHSKNTIVLNTTFLLVFQVSLCLLTGCVGVSLVWSANAGIVFMNICWLIKSEGYEKVSTRINIAVFALIVSTAAWTFYLIASDHWITSFAHFCAFFLGVGIDFLVAVTEERAG